MYIEENSHIFPWRKYKKTSNSIKHNYSLNAKGTDTDLSVIQGWRSKTKKCSGEQTVLSKPQGIQLRTNSATNLNLSSVIESSCWKRGAGTLCLDFSELSPFKSELQTLDEHHQGLWQIELCYLCMSPHEELQYWETPGHLHLNTLHCTFHKQKTTKTWALWRAEATFLSHFAWEDQPTFYSYL